MDLVAEEQGSQVSVHVGSQCKRQALRTYPEKEGDPQPVGVAQAEQTDNSKFPKRISETQTIQK